MTRAACVTWLHFADLAQHEDAFSEANRPDVEVIAGHTHYNELLNDGRVIYGATRSTGEIEEGEGKPGFSIVTLYDRVPSWRFKETGSDWPFVQIVAPADVRLVTRPADAAQVPRPGEVEIVAKLFGGTPHPVMPSVDDGVAQPMIAISGTPLWSLRIDLDPGLHRIVASVGTDRDVVGTQLGPNKNGKHW